MANSWMTEGFDRSKVMDYNKVRQTMTIHKRQKSNPNELPRDWATVKTWGTIWSSAVGMTRKERFINLAWDL